MNTVIRITCGTIVFLMAYAYSYATTDSIKIAHLDGGGEVVLDVVYNDLVCAFEASFPPLYTLDTITIEWIAGNEWLLSGAGSEPLGDNAVTHGYVLVNHSGELWLVADSTKPQHICTGVNCSGCRMLMPSGPDPADCDCTHPGKGTGESKCDYSYDPGGVQGMILSIESCEA